MNKIKCLQKRLAKKNAYAVLATSPVTQRYFTGFDFSDGYLLVTAEKAYMFADFRYIEAAKKYASEDLSVVLLRDGAAACIGPKLQAHQIKNLGYEDNRMTCRELNELKKQFPLLNFVPCGCMIDRMAEYKSNDEFDRIIKAQKITDDAFEHILRVMTPEMTEKEVALELEYFMRRQGADGCSFPIIAVSGKASSLPHGVPRDVKLESGFLTMDFGAVVDGYCSDMTRTVVCGKANAEMKDIYKTVLAAQQEAIDFIKEGVDCAEADKIARDIIDGAGYKGCFGHSLGHGVGMYIHEMPRLAPSQRGKTLRQGHVVTVEPGIYIEGKYGVRIEDMLLITPDGPRDITASPKEMIEIF